VAPFLEGPLIAADLASGPPGNPDGWAALAVRHGLRSCWSMPILSQEGKALGAFALFHREPLSPNPDQQALIERFTHIARIATERKRAEEALIKAQRELAHMSRVTTMVELTASLAHEINQPIAAAVTNASACVRWLARSDPDMEEARAAASRMVKDATRAADIIGRVRALFNKGSPRREPVDVNEIIREMIVLLRTEATRYSISVRAQLAAGLDRVKADRVQLQQVFMNLMLNGIDAMKAIDSTGELVIRSQTDGDGALLISISDTGVGLPVEKADQIFSAFFTTKHDGTGMGLPISRSIIESYGGRLWATRNPGPGATFYFTLPTRGEA
jgi:signal transduction histidine kinase